MFFNKKGTSPLFNIQMPKKSPACMTRVKVPERMQKSFMTIFTDFVDGLVI